MGEEPLLGTRPHVPSPHSNSLFSNRGGPLTARWTNVMILPGAREKRRRPLFISGEQTRIPTAPECAVTTLVSGCQHLGTKREGLAAEHGDHLGRHRKSTRRIDSKCKLIAVVSNHSANSVLGDRPMSPVKSFGLTQRVVLFYGKNTRIPVEPFGKGGGWWR